MTKPPKPPAGITSISTDQTDAREKAEFWTDVVSQHFIEVECRSQTGPEPFFGTILARDIADVMVSQLTSAAQQVRHDSSRHGGDDKEFFLLNIQRHGRGLVQQDGRRAVLEPGDMALYSSARDYDLVFDAAFSQTVLVFPGDKIRALQPHIDVLTATTLKHVSPTTKLLTMMADGNFDTPFETLQASAGAHAANALTEILAASLADRAPVPSGRESKLALFHLARIKQYLLQHLYDPELSVAQVSQALRISPAHIHRLFSAEEQTLSAWVRARRLHASKTALADPAKAHLSIGQIAFSCGFNNAAHFSRAFRQAYGLSAREWRSGGAVPAG